MREWLSGGLTADYGAAIRFFLQLGSTGCWLILLVAAMGVAALVTGSMAASDEGDWRHWAGLLTIALGGGAIAFCLATSRAFHLTWEVERLIDQDEIRDIHDSPAWQVAIATLLGKKERQMPLWMDAAIDHAASQYARDFYLSPEALQGRLAAAARRAMAEGIGLRAKPADQSDPPC
ncbi:hypothetical protein GTO89_00055 [Heliobacterium gestii]|uniref:Uncharacterized protein n=1 Tax=Heliomicrobium gestii TaxID=2699 RepID=A0A845LCY2_HELGE|nr:hypothetical protein [Heliomicrobium gestii]MBM7865154.1 hypothetical protein [Heliomicrobium gestii]MZP41423.1 hypothetical protein [Heliomicrobium gestii]